MKNILSFKNIWKYAFLKKEKKGTKLKASGLPVVNILIKTVTNIYHLKTENWFVKCHL